VESLESPQATSTVDLKILRPPVVLVHGLWGSTDDWNTFTPLLNDARFFTHRTGYSEFLGGVVSWTSPEIPEKLRNKVTMSSLGFAFNAPYVLADVELALADFRRVRNVAVVQADVIAHSMGGVVARTVKMLPGFIGHTTFGAGYINKLITIGTPHLGSPLASQLLDTANSCIRDALTDSESFAIETATMAGSTVFGAVGDLRGDGWGGSMSAALGLLQSSDPLPTASIAASMTSSNLNGLQCSVCASTFIRLACPGSPLAANLTAQDWPTVFGQASDGVVPRTSQLANLSGREVVGTIHSAGLYRLDFEGPSELEELSNIPLIAIHLLNSSINSADFHLYR
jgi:pimeloyl-ACP methyl ester carboxylesterase